MTRITGDFATEAVTIQTESSHHLMADIYYILAEAYNHIAETEGKKYADAYINTLQGNLPFVKDKTTMEENIRKDTERRWKEVESLIRQSGFIADNQEKEP